MTKLNQEEYVCEPDKMGEVPDVYELDLGETAVIDTTEFLWINRESSFAGVFKLATKAKTWLYFPSQVIPMILSARNRFGQVIGLLCIEQFNKDFVFCDSMNVEKLRDSWKKGIELEDKFIAEMRSLNMIPEA